jgi:hypothetical protein
MDKGTMTRIAATASKRLNAVDDSWPERRVVATVDSRRTACREAARCSGTMPYTKRWAQEPPLLVPSAARAVLWWARDTGKSPKIATTRRGIGNG